MKQKLNYQVPKDFETSKHEMWQVFLLKERVERLWTLIDGWVVKSLVLWMKLLLGGIFTPTEKKVKKTNNLCDIF